MLFDFAEYQESQHGGLAGGKGSALAYLFQKGYPVPKGFVIAANSFDQKGLLSGSWAETVARFRAMLDSGVNAVAVRSSALAEDSAVASFAGEFESVLNVRTVHGLKEAVKTVFNSLNSERVERYAKSLGADTDHRIAIVVQEMVDADFAGVLFTVEPVTQNRNILTGNFVSGLAEQLVSGAVNAEAFTMDRLQLSYHGDDALAGIAPDLGRLALKIESEFGVPQDIEWAVKDGKVYILQSRPVTTLSKKEIWNSTLDGDYFWTNTNVGEALGSVMTPYTWSVIQRSFDDFYRPPVGFSMLGNIAGHVYMNFSVLFGLANRFAVRPETVLSFTSSFVGQVPQNITLPVPKIGFVSSIRFIGHLVAKMVGSGLRLKKHIAWAKAKSPAYCEDLVESIAAVGSYDAALRVGDEIKETGDRDFAMLLLVSNQLLSNRDALKQQLERHLSGDDVETLMSGLGGDGILQSMGPMVAIEQVAKGSLSRQEFVRMYGHRGPQEVELAMPRTGEDPAWIDKLIAQSGEADIKDLLDKQQAARSEAWSRVERKVKSGRYRRLRRLAAAASEAAQNRELVRSELVRFLMVARRLALRIGELTALGDDIFFLEIEEVRQLLLGDESQRDKILRRKDVFAGYEQFPSLPNIISGSIDLETWRDNPNRRTDFHDCHKSLDIPDDQRIRGFPGAAGVVEGTVRVIAHHDEMHLLQKGEILVTSFTNVGWTPVFPKALAVVTDIGAPLSHAAIVARELGIPAVVGTGNASMKLKSGDRVRVNGAAGVVEKL